LVWFLLLISIVLLITTLSGALIHKPKVYVVSLFSNASILILYYIPSLYGVDYYFINTIKIIPLMLLLIYLACNDRAYNWSYRAMCTIFGMQIFNSAWHILAGLNSPYYDQISFLTSLMELLIITGGCNVKFTRMVDRFGYGRDNFNFGSWAKLHYKEARNLCPKD